MRYRHPDALHAPTRAYAHVRRARYVQAAAQPDGAADGLRHIGALFNLWQGALAGVALLAGLLAIACADPAARSIAHVAGLMAWLAAIMVLLACNAGILWERHPPLCLVLPAIPGNLAWLACVGSLVLEMADAWTLVCLLLAVPPAWALAAQAGIVAGAVRKGLLKISRAARAAK